MRLVKEMTSNTPTAIISRNRTDRRAATTSQIFTTDEVISSSVPVPSTGVIMNSSDIPLGFWKDIPDYYRRHKGLWDSHYQVVVYDDLGMIYDPISLMSFPISEFIEWNEIDGLGREIDITVETEIFCEDGSEGTVVEDDDTDDYWYRRDNDMVLIHGSHAADDKPAAIKSASGYGSTYYHKPEPKEEIFTSDLCVSEDIIVVVHNDILDICREIYAKVDKDEFSILIKGRWNNNFWITTNEYAIPKQEVGYASVDYDLDDLLLLKQAGFNTVIHGHPVGCKTFSGEDMKYINAHFDCSVLFNDGSFIQSCMPLKITDDFLYQTFPQKIQIYNPNCAHVAVDQMSKITKKTFVKTYAPVVYAKNYKDYNDQVSGVKKNLDQGAVANRLEDWDNMTDDEYYERIAQGQIWYGGF